MNLPGGGVGEKVGEKQETETATGQQQQQGVSPKLFAPFFEVRLKLKHTHRELFLRIHIRRIQHMVFQVYSHTTINNQISIGRES